MLLVGCKSDLRTHLTTLVELSNHRQTPVSYDQVGGSGSTHLSISLDGNKLESLLSFKLIYRYYAYLTVIKLLER